MTTQGVDYMNTQSAATVAALKANNVAFVCRYYDASGGTSAKCLDAGEAQTLLATGLEIFVVYETAPTAVGYFTRAQGRFDGDAAMAAAKRAGQPPQVPIFFAVDYDASDSDLAGPITEYFNGLYERIGQAYALGVYGSHRVCAFGQSRWPVVLHYWQTYAWSGGRKAAGLDLYQYENDVQLAGVSIDRDEAYVSGWRGAAAAGGGRQVTKDEYAKVEADGLSLEDRVKATIRAVYAAEIAPALETEITQRVAAGEQDAVAKAIKAVGQKLAS